MMLIYTLGYSQDYKSDSNSFTGVFEAKDKNKTELFSLINKWLSINYKQSKYVIQLNDLESGTIIVKGLNTVKTKNALKKLYPLSLPEFNYYELNHLIEINVKDGKYRITYSIIDIVSGIGPNDRFSNECIDFDGVDQIIIDNYNDRMDKLLRTGLVGKKKRDEFRLETKEYLDNVNKDIIESAKSIMLSVQKTIQSSYNDKW